MPVAILNHGNTVKFTEYSFLANVFAARGYLVVSIQHDLPTDAPMVTKVGELYVGRLPQYQRDIANIKFAVEEMKKVQPNADYDHLTMVGHSMGADVSLYLAKLYPDQHQEGGDARQPARSVHDRRQVQDPVVPFEGSGVQDRSGRHSLRRGCARRPGSQWFAPPSSTTTCATPVLTTAKASIQDMVDKFLDDDSPLKPVTSASPLMTDAGPVTPYAPVKN